MSDAVSEDGLNLVGASSLASLPGTEACDDFHWSLSESTAGTYLGDFNATCANDVQLDGTASGTLVGDLLDFTATRTATPKDLPPYPFTLNGTGRLVNETIELEYSGTTCLGPISRTEILTSS